MAQIIKEIRVDVSQPNVFQAIVAKQNDCNSRFLKVTLTDCGVKINIESTAKVTINANRPDGESQSFVGQANNDGTVTVPLAQWMLLVVGLLKCDVSVIDTTDGERLTTTTFYVDVQEAANSNTDYSENPEGEFRVITPVTVVDENSTYPSAKAVYSYGQDILADTKVTASASGSAITIESANAPLQALKLYGKTTQDGTPTPTEPKELKSVGDSGSFSVGVYGRNLLDVNNTTQTSNGVTFTVNANKSITASGTATNDVLFYLLKEKTFKLPKGCYKITSFPWSIEIILNGVTQKTVVGDGTTFEITDEICVLRPIWWVGRGSTVNTTIYPMILLADETDTSYEPCLNKPLTMPYTLRSQGELKDDIDFTRGVFTQKCGYVKPKDVTGKDMFPVGNGNVCLAVPVPNKKPFGTANIKCTHAKLDYDNHTEGTFYENGTYVVLVGNSTDTYETLMAKYGDAYILYSLATPIETPLTETELNAYRQLMTNSGNTTILSEADMQLDYYKPSGQALGNIHTQINKDYFKLTQAIISTGGN